MKRTLLLLIAVLLIGCSGKQQNENPMTKTETVSIQLPSMVCGTCAKTIQKAIYHVDGVKDVDVSVEKKVAEVKFVSMQTNLQAIEEAITEAGYDANSRKRNPDAYEKLDKCCKIDG